MVCSHWVTLSKGSFTKQRCCKLSLTCTGTAFPCGVPVSSRTCTYSSCHVAIGMPNLTLDYHTIAISQHQPHETLSLCTSDVLVDRRSFVSRGHPSTTQPYTSGWTCMKWTGGRVTSGGERWTHTRGKQKHSCSSAYRTLPFQHTHY